MKDLRSLIDIFDIAFGQKLLGVLVHRVVVDLSVMKLHYLVFASLFSCYHLFMSFRIVTEVDQWVLSYSVTLCG